jgi:hypothetical protein
MKNTLIPLALGVCVAFGLATVARAQDATASPKPTDEALERLEELDDEINEHIQTWRKEQQELAKKAAEAKDKGGVVPAMSMRPDFSKFLERLNEWADGSGGEDAALYLTKIVDLDGFGPGSKGGAAFDRLLADHAKSPSWAKLGRLLPMLDRMLPKERKAEVLEILAESPDANVRGWIALAQHSAALESAALESAEYKMARAALLAAAEKATDKNLKGELEGPIELREKFGVGATAPDIEGIDLDGVAFKLSDYKGKIVFLDFWGDW